VGLELEPQEILVVLDSERGERVLGVHAPEKAGQHPVETPYRAADQRAQRNHQNGIRGKADELAYGCGGLGVLRRSLALLRLALERLQGLLNDVAHDRSLFLARLVERVELSLDAGRHLVVPA